jgi:hypothetical protein
VRRPLTLLALAATFGAADQFLGARAWILGSWATDTSLLSAPWLLVAFVAGWSQQTAKRAMVLGFLCTLAALAGYWAMTLSPVEGAVVTLRGVRGLVVGQSNYVLGALLSGPLFGWLGYRWGTRRDWKSALGAAVVVGLEPLAHVAAGTPVTVPGVWAAEAVVGSLMALYVVVGARRRPSTD